MNRKIIGYHLDEVNDMVADLDCGHGQHVRHQPPFVNRVWATTAEGRESKLGAQLDCLRCDALELPEGYLPYKQTPEFDEHTTPHGLQRAHTTKRGIWGKIVVLQGSLLYTLEQPAIKTFILKPDTPGWIPPELPHHVEPGAAVRFFVEFYSTAR